MSATLVAIPLALIQDAAAAPAHRADHPPRTAHHARPHHTASLRVVVAPGPETGWALVDATAPAATAQIAADNTTTTTTEAPPAPTATTEAPRPVPTTTTTEAPPPPPPPPPAPAATSSLTGVASWYVAPTGTCAAVGIPYGTTVHVTDVATGASTSCTVDDHLGDAARVIDLAEGTFAQIAPTSAGVITVTVTW